MPVARASLFYREYSLVMRLLDRMDPSDRYRVRLAVKALFSPGCADTNAARATIERIAAKYALAEMRASHADGSP